MPKEYREKYYLEHKDKIKEHQRELIYCDYCKKNVTRNSIIKHRRTNKHMQNEYINNIRIDSDKKIDSIIETIELINNNLQNINYFVQKNIENPIDNINNNNIDNNIVNNENII